jgi:vacuolar-type H+-ATPase subunit H
VVTIDILALVDRLEDLFQKGTHIPLTRRKALEEQAFLDILDQMRTAIPQEMRQAKRVLEERDQLISDARDEAERIQSEAQQHAVLLLSQQGIIQAAEERAEVIEREAVTHRDQLLAEADQHCVSVLAALEDELNTLLASTRKGIQNLQDMTDQSGQGRMESGEKGR